MGGFRFGRSEEHFLQGRVVSQVGIGTAPISVFRRFEQGPIQNTGGLLDAGIQGEGFFIVQDGDLTQYTRAGNFQLNSDRQLVTINSEQVKGWTRDPSTGLLRTGTERAINLQGQDRIEPASTDILEGRMIVEIGMAVVRPAEFIILKFSHKMQEA